ncbi:MAG: 16S rRNA (cytidine(1402)-2'-O)-methyltransferase [Lactobacillales bacterium]|nr:16S rRNA (cytidine(1402)-2'-O)-methyltransferase [Lactobacillales bacterium]
MSQKSYINDKPILYLISTPIGNMEDITLRAINILKEVEVIFSEDTRVTRQLLNYLNINKKLISSHNYNETKNENILLDYLNKGYNVGVVTDRGTPVISDPGYELVKIAIKNDFNVVSLPGPTALIPALTVSGINPSPFTFYGFLNSKDSKRKKELEVLKQLKTTLIFYEAPHRIIKTLEDIKDVLGNRKISISREISKKFEEVYRGTIEEVIKELEEVKGEIVLIVEGNTEINTYDNLTIAQHVNLYIKEGYDSKEAIKKVAKERNVPKSEIYNIYHRGD